MENPVICRANPLDSKEIIELIHTAMAQYVKTSNIPANVTSLKETEKDIEKYIESDHVLKAVINDRIIAAIRVSRHDDKTAQISRFAVLPKMQNVGVGRLLFKSAEDYIIKTGFEKTFLYTAFSNKSSLRFYESSGFVIDSISKDRGYERAKLSKFVQPKKPLS